MLFAKFEDMLSTYKCKYKGDKCLPHVEPGLKLHASLWILHVCSVCWVMLVCVPHLSPPRWILYLSILHSLSSLKMCSALTTFPSYCLFCFYKKSASLVIFLIVLIYHEATSATVILFLFLTQCLLLLSILFLPQFWNLYC